MFDMNPLHLPDAIMQHWIMLFVAAILGFIIGYISRQQVAHQLETAMANTLRDLDDCQRLPATLQVSVTGNDENVTLQRIAARAGELDFNRIGYASAHEADDLKVIVGVGPFLEKKLNAIGIYTFQQIANFTPTDIDQVNDVIEFFPGRIQRENWVGQSTRLANS